MFPPWKRRRDNRPGRKKREGGNGGRGGRLTLQWPLEVVATPTLPLIAKRRRDSGLEVFYESQILMNRSFRVVFSCDRLYDSSTISMRI